MYSEAAVQNSYKNCNLDNFGEIIVHYLKLGVYTLVKMPSNNFQFRTGANLSYFTVDEKHSKFPSGKKLSLIVESGTSCWIRINYLLSYHKYLVLCFYSDVRFTKKIDQHVLLLSDTDLGNVHFRQRFYLVIEQPWKGNVIYIKSYKGISWYSFGDLKNNCEESGLRSFNLEIIDRDSGQRSRTISQEIHTMHWLLLKIHFLLNSRRAFKYWQHNLS